MDSNSSIILVSTLVIVSYLFDLISRKIKFPSVLLLLFLGMGIQQLVRIYGIDTFDFEQALPTIGTIGLILIVLDGSLELHYNPEKRTVIKRSFLMALLGMVGSVSLIIGILLWTTDGNFNQCLANAIPFGVISSSIAIPSAQVLNRHNREFVIYESSFSDILGVMAMNFVVYNTDLHVGSILQFGWELLLILAITLVSCLFILFLLGKIKHSVKFFLILALLLLIYALGKQIHLAPLILILAFGLLMANADLIGNKTFRRIFIYEDLHHDLRQLNQVTSESAFLMRTFFFTIFGFSLVIDDIKHLSVYEMGGLILLAIFLPRLLLLKIVAKQPVSPLWAMTPRGLISILLFITLPPHLKIASVHEGLMVFVVLLTSVLMTIGLLTSKKNQPHPL